MKSDTLMNLIKKFGLEAAMEFRDLVAEQIYALKDVVETEELDCEFELRRSFDVFIDAAEAESVREGFLAALRKKERWTRDVALVGEGSAEQVRTYHHPPLSLRKCNVDANHHLGHLDQRRKASPQRISLLAVAVQVCLPATGTTSRKRQRKSANKHPRDQHRPSKRHECPCNRSRNAES